VRYAEYDVVIVGGGFFGCSLAAFLASSHNRVLIIERDTDFMQRASYVNQARVHNGYHYPRSILTALRSRVNFPRFVQDYRDCIVDSFEKYYAIPQKFSKVSAGQYKHFMERIGAPIKPARKGIKRLFNLDLIEEVFEVTEYAFDAARLKDIAVARMRNAGVEESLGTRVVELKQLEDQKIGVICRHADDERFITASKVFNCAYSQINELLTASGLSRIKLKHELTEMAVIEVPDELKKMGITVMCGPFFSTMPFPPRNSHTLSHVRYTPHCSWLDTAEGYVNAYDFFSRAPKESKYIHMIHDAQRYLPILGEARYLDSLWEIKTVLPLSEADDSRPILFKPHYGLRNLTCIMGGKIDNIYDAMEEYKITLEEC